MQPCCCEKQKRTPRSAEEKKKLAARINRITGQLQGVRRMLEEDRYCDDVLIQLAAADKAIRSLSAVILEEHMHSCLIENIQSGNLAVVDEIVDLFKKFQ